MKYRIVYVIVGLAIIVADTVLALIYPGVLIYSF
jgi:hypothetical protein